MNIFLLKLSYLVPDKPLLLCKVTRYLQDKLWRTIIKMIFLLPLKRRFVLYSELFIMIMWQKRNVARAKTKFLPMINKCLNL